MHGFQSFLFDYSPIFDYPLSIYFQGYVENRTAYDTHGSEKETERMIQFINTILSKLE